MKSIFLMFAGCGLLSLAIQAQTPAPIQAPASPTGIDTVAPVMAGGSDAASATFMADILPSATAMLQAKLGERVALADSTALRLDPSKLVLQNQSDIRVYFVGEGAGWHNALGFNTWNVGESAPKGAVGDNAQLIFPDASSTVSTYDPAKVATRTTTDPLLPGDFVNLGTFNANTVLDFFLVSRGATALPGTADAFVADAARNKDKISHTIAFVLPDSPFLIIGFEDQINGGDKDFNDVLFAIDIGMANVASLTAAPEPALWLVLACFAALAFHRRGRVAVAA